MSREAVPSAALISAIRSITRAVLQRPVTEQYQWMARIAQTAPRLSEPHRLEATFIETLFLARDENTRKGAQQSLRRLEPNVGQLDAMGQVSVQTALTNVYYFLGEVEKSSDCAFAAASVAEVVGDPREYARALNNLGLMLLAAYEPEAESLFEPLRDVIEKSGAWRFCQVSHWMPAIFYAWYGRAHEAAEALKLQRTIIPSGKSVEFLSGFRRYTESLYNLLIGAYSDVIGAFIARVLPRDSATSYSILTSVAVAYALSGDHSSSKATLTRAAEIRKTLSILEVVAVQQSIFLIVSQRVVYDPGPAP